MRHELSDALEQQLDVGLRVSSDGLELASPCDGWTVRQVLSHSIGVTRKFTEFAIGATDEPHTPPGDLVGPDHRAALDDTVRRARVAWASADMSRSCHLGFGTFPAEVAAGINLFDVLAHTWDVATATGIDLDQTNDLWSVGLEAAREVIAPERDPRHYAAEIPVSSTAPAMVRFLAFLGRGT